MNKLDFQLPNHLLEELAMDVYDEVDRRETEAGIDSFLYSNFYLFNNTIIMFEISFKFCSALRRGELKGF